MTHAPSAHAPSTRALAASTKRASEPTKRPSAPSATEYQRKPFSDDDDDFEDNDVWEEVEQHPRKELPLIPTPSRTVSKPEKRMRRSAGSSEATKLPEEPSAPLSLSSSQGNTSRCASLRDRASEPMKKRRSTPSSTEHHKKPRSDDDDFEDNGEWEEVEQHPRKELPLIRSAPVTRVSQAQLNHVFLSNDRISGLATDDDIIRLSFPQLADVILPLLNKDLPTLDLSVAKMQNHAEELFAEFQARYVPVMDRLMLALSEIMFSSVDQAISVLNLILRSFVSGFCVHKTNSYPVTVLDSTGKQMQEATPTTNTRRFLVQCHTRKHKKGKENDTEMKRKNCPWSALVEYDDKSAHFYKIQSFSVHTFGCFCCFSRMTPNEVSFRASIPSNHLVGVLTRFKQTHEAKKAIYMRRYRMGAAVQSLIDQDLLARLKKQEIHDSISNHKEFGVEPDVEVTLILRYLSFLVDKKELETFVSFGESDASTRIEVTSINLMWKEGKSLLASHSDVIFCDSMWNVAANAYYVLTIVVVDENYDIRLAALSLASRERKSSWKSFFDWVKNVVPAFNPKCIVTDGALYIDDGFKAAIRGKALNVVCWWHQRENVLKKIGIKRDVGRALLNITFARNNKVKKYLIKKAKELAEQDVDVAASTSFERMLKNCSRTALISLKIFTAGTVTNSFSESINSVLRRIGLNTRYRMLTVLRYLDNFASQHNSRMPHRFTPSYELSSVLSDEAMVNVTAGALCHFQRKIKNPLKSSVVESTNGKGGVITERLVVKVRERNRLACRIFSRRGRFQLRLFSKCLRWTVDWSGAVPRCSCNAPVYCGIPCAHIVRNTR